MIMPVTFACLATAQIVTHYMPAIAAVFTLLATAIPLVYRASKTDKSIVQFTRLAGEFTNLRDRFRQLGEVGVHKEVATFESEFRVLMARMDKARKCSETPPNGALKKRGRRSRPGICTMTMTRARRS
jgi:hypothetical protein